MFRNRERGLSNTLYWFFEVWNSAYMENYNIVSEGKTKKLQRFSRTAVSETSTTSSTISVRIGSAAFIFFKRLMRD